MIRYQSSQSQREKEEKIKKKKSLLISYSFASINFPSFKYLLCVLSDFLISLSFLKRDHRLYFFFPIPSFYWLLFCCYFMIYDVIATVLKWQFSLKILSFLNLIQMQFSWIFEWCWFYQWIGSKSQFVVIFLFGETRF